MHQFYVQLSIYTNRFTEMYEEITCAGQGGYTPLFQISMIYINQNRSKVNLFLNQVEDLLNPKLVELHKRSHFFPPDIDEIFSAARM